MTIEEAEDYVWNMLCQAGGQWRVRHRRKTVASGSGRSSDEAPWTPDRAAVWDRR